MLDASGASLVRVIVNEIVLKSPFPKVIAAICYNNRRILSSFRAILIEELSKSKPITPFNIKTDCS
jgi:hypothetical protein